MNLLAWFNPARWVMLAVLCGSLTAGYFTWRSHERGIGAAPWIAAVSKQKIEAAATLKVKTDEANASTKALKDFSIQRGEDDAINSKTVSILADKLHASTIAGRLRDPAGCGNSGSSAPGQGTAGTGASAPDGTDASGFLSKQFTDFLLVQAASADKINAAYISCRADARKLRSEWPK